MFGFGNRRQVRNDTFSTSRLRNAAIAGVGMLAWRWWKNRQSSGQTQNYQGQTQNYQDRTAQNRAFSESGTGSGGSF